MSTGEMISARRRGSSEGEQDRPQAEQPEHHGLLHDLSSAFKETYNMMIGNYPDREGIHRLDKDEIEQRNRLREEQGRSAEIQTDINEVTRRRRDEEKNRQRMMEMEERQMEHHEMAPEVMEPRQNELLDLFHKSHLLV